MLCVSLRAIKPIVAVIQASKEIPSPVVLQLDAGLIQIAHWTKLVRTGIVSIPV